MRTEAPGSRRRVRAAALAVGLALVLGAACWTAARRGVLEGAATDALRGM
jgi:hypothetical protein